MLLHLYAANKKNRNKFTRDALEHANFKNDMHKEKHFAMRENETAGEFSPEGFKKAEGINTAVDTSCYAEKEGIDNTTKALRDMSINAMHSED